MKLKLAYQLFGLVIITIGYGLLIYVDWRIALGVFLVVWANNIATIPERTRSSFAH